MTAHGVVLSLAAGIGTLYLGWTLGERNNDGGWVGWILGTLVLAGCLLLDAGV